MGMNLSHTAQHYSRVAQATHGDMSMANKKDKTGKNGDEETYAKFQKFDKEAFVNMSEPEFWESVDHYLSWSMPSRDQHGHGKQISFKVADTMSYLGGWLCSLMRCPSLSEAYRRIYAIGIYTALYIMCNQVHPELKSKIEKYHKFLDLMEYFERLDTLKGMKSTIKSRLTDGRYASDADMLVKLDGVVKQFEAYEGSFNDPDFEIFGKSLNDIISSIQEDGKQKDEVH